MKKTIVITIGLFFIIACHKKAVPVITERNIEPFYPSKPTTAVSADLALGKTIYISRCARCHDLPKTEQYTIKRWEGILTSMIPKARLNEEQSVHLTAYVKANASK